MRTYRNRKEIDVHLMTAGADETFQQVYNYLARAAIADGWFTLWGDISDATCENAALFLLHQRQRQQHSTLVICSEGGSGADARGLLGIIELYKATGLVLRTFAVGLVASAAFDIFTAGTAGHRYVHEICILMTHASEASTRNKKEHELEDALDELVLQRYTRMRKAERDRYLATGDWFFSPTEAVAIGAADHIIKLGRQLPAALPNIGEAK